MLAAWLGFACWTAAQATPPAASWEAYCEVIDGKGPSGWVEVEDWRPLAFYASHRPRIEQIALQRVALDWGEGLYDRNLAFNPRANASSSHLGSLEGQQIFAVRHKVDWRRNERGFEGSIVERLILLAGPDSRRLRPLHILESNQAEIVSAQTSFVREDVVQFLCTHSGTGGLRQSRFYSFHRGRPVQTELDQSLSAPLPAFLDEGWQRWRPSYKADHPEDFPDWYWITQFDWQRLSGLDYWVRSGSKAGLWLAQSFDLVEGRLVRTATRPAWITYSDSPDLHAFSPHPRPLGYLRRHSPRLEDSWGKRKLLWEPLPDEGQCEVKLLGEALGWSLWEIRHALGNQFIASIAFGREPSNLRVLASFADTHQKEVSISYWDLGGDPAHPGVLLKAARPHQKSLLFTLFEDVWVRAALADDLAEEQLPAAWRLLPVNKGEDPLDSVDLQSLSRPIRAAFQSSGHSFSRLFELRYAVQAGGHLIPENASPAWISHFDAKPGALDTAGPRPLRFFEQHFPQIRQLPPSARTRQRVSNSKRALNEADSRVEWHALPDAGKAVSEPVGRLEGVRFWKIRQEVQPGRVQEMIAAGSAPDELRLLFSRTGSIGDAQLQAEIISLVGAQAGTALALSWLGRSDELVSTPSPAPLLRKPRIYFTIQQGVPLDAQLAQAIQETALLRGMQCLWADWNPSDMTFRCGQASVALTLVQGRFVPLADQ